MRAPVRGGLKIGGIQSVIVLSFTAMAVLSMILLGAVLYSVFSAGAETNAAASSGQLLDQVSLNLESYIAGMSQISELICGSLGQGGDGSRENLENLLKTTSAIRKDIVTMAVYSSRGNLLVSYPSGAYDSAFAVSEQDWFTKAALSKNARFSTSSST